MQQPTGLQLPEPSHEKHPPSRPSNMRPGQPKACPQRPNPKRRSPNNRHTGVRRNLGKGKIDSDDIFEMETEWIPALIFLNHLRTCINVHTSKPNTLIDKIHKPHSTYLQVLTNQQRSRTLTFKYAFFKDSTNKFINMVSMFNSRAFKGGRLLLPREKGVKQGF